MKAKCPQLINPDNSDARKGASFEARPPVMEETVEGDQLGPWVQAKVIKRPVKGSFGSGGSMGGRQDTSADGIHKREEKEASQLDRKGKLKSAEKVAAHWQEKKHATKVNSGMREWSGSAKETAEKEDINMGSGSRFEALLQDETTEMEEVSVMHAEESINSTKDKEIKDPE